MAGRLDGTTAVALRQEVAGRHVRVSLVEPGATDTELRDHLRPEIRAESLARVADVEMLKTTDIAEAVGYIATRARHVAVNEILIRPTTQE